MKKLINDRFDNDILHILMLILVIPLKLIGLVAMIFLEPDGEEDDFDSSTDMENRSDDHLIFFGTPLDTHVDPSHRNPYE